jgi:glycosyltransferase involved in cell wall biosynthesis
LNNRGVLQVDTGFHPELTSREWERSMRSTKISVAVVTYNHEKYIAQCLDSILMQKGTFDIEVIIADDYSTDKTGQIVQDYQEKYPDKVVVLPTTANIGMARNAKRCLGACSGDYIVFCDGDDYMTDTYKLQKQLEFLESHPDYALCFNAVMLYFEDENRYAPHIGQLLLQKDTLTTADLIENNCIGSACSCMHRASIVRKLPEEIFDNLLGDWMLNMACGRMGKIGFIRDWMSVYRIQSAGLWSGKSKVDQYRDLLTAIDICNPLFSYEYDDQFRKLKESLLKQRLYESNQRLHFIKKCGNLLIRAIRNPRKAYNTLRTIILNLE